jgi:DNA-binding NarL/FixJ family response regulator
MSMRIVIVEDHALVRTGLRTSLQGAGMEVVGEAADGIVGFDVVKACRPDVAIIDIGLPGKNGIVLSREIKGAGSAQRIVILTMEEDERNVLSAIETGAEGYCVKSSGPDIVIDAVRTVAAGGAYFDPRIATYVLRRLTGTTEVAAESPLTPRETEILRFISEGCSNADICERLFVSMGTVKAHVAEILRKLSASDRAHAATLAVRRGYIS